LNNHRVYGSLYNDRVKKSKAIPITIPGTAYWAQIIQPVEEIYPLDLLLLLRERRKRLIMILILVTIRETESVLKRSLKRVPVFVTSSFSINQETRINKGKRKPIHKGIQIKNREIIV
jgi:hypothetical protein